MTGGALELEGARIKSFAVLEPYRRQDIGQGATYDRVLTDIPHGQEARRAKGPIPAAQQVHHALWSPPWVTAVRSVSISELYSSCLMARTSKLIRSMYGCRNAVS